ncbi:Single-stranded DNA-binding protein [Gammaproteobacteria bacterium]|jgi:single-strand DNA-binding protein
MNSITVAGTIGKDAEVKRMANGDALCNFSVADGQGKDKPTIWWNCSLYGKRAEALSQYLVKGQAVTVSGTVSEREWTDKEGGKRKSMDVRVGDVALQGGRRDAEPQQERRAAPKAEAYDDGGDVPF